MLRVLKTTPPPLFFVAAFVIGYAIHIQSNEPDIIPTDTSRWLGLALIGLSFGIVAPVLLQFRRADTPFDVGKSPTSLVTTGAFRFSRNPGYVALILLYLGGAVFLQSIAIVVLFVPCFVALDRLVVPHEEANLEATFGEAYIAYKRSVRRWI